MGYGARARRVPALGGAVLTDVNIYKLMLLCKTERGIVNADGYPVVHSEIYSMNDFYPKCGGFNSSYYGAYVAQSFYDELEREVSCEMKVLSDVDSSAVQATYALLDTTASPAKIFDVSAGRKNLADKSAFGNKIAIKTTPLYNITMKMAGNIANNATSIILDSVDNLEVGHYIRLVDGVKTEYRAIVTITPSTKTITVAAVTEATGFDAATTTVSRLDWRLEVAVKDSVGDYQKKEIWEGPFAKSNTIGLAADVNDETDGSDYVILAVNASNASPPETQFPVTLSSWTALASGSDGTAADDAAWNTLATTYLTSEDFAIMLAPESTSLAHNGNMATFCTDGYKGMYYAQSSNKASEATLKNFGATLRGSIVFAMVPSDKWIQVDNPTVSGGKIDIPKVGVDAAHWFNTYYKFGESKVAAGNKSEMVLKTRAKLVDNNGLVHDDRDGVGDRLIRNYSVNICRYRRGKGITNNSARTLSTDGGYRYQNQVMMYLLYSRSIVEYLQTIEQDKAGLAAQESHYNAVWSYMKDKYDAGHLFIGQKEDGTMTTFKDVCIIVNDFTINTLVNISNGIEETFLQYVAPPPIEEPILSLASAAVTTVKR